MSENEADPISTLGTPPLSRYSPTSTSAVEDVQYPHADMDIMVPVYGAVNMAELKSLFVCPIVTAPVVSVYPTSVVLVATTPEVPSDLAARMILPVIYVPRTLGLIVSVSPAFCR